MNAQKTVRNEPVSPAANAAAWQQASTQYQMRAAAIDQAQAEYFTASAAESSAAPRVRETRREADRLRQQVAAAEQRADVETLADLREQLAAAETRATAAEAELHAAVAKREALNQHIGELQAALRDDPPAVVVTDLAAHAAHVEALRAQVQAAEQKAADMLATAPAVDAGALIALNQRRLALMADAHEGTGDPAALEAVNAEWQQLQADAERAVGAGKDIAAVAGELRRRAEPLRRALADAERRGPELQRLYWLGVARQAGAAFTASAEALAEQYMRLMGLEHILIHECGCADARLFDWSARDLKLLAPAKMIAGTGKPARGPFSPGVLFESATALHRQPAAELAAAERRRLVALLEG